MRVEHLTAPYQLTICAASIQLPSRKLPTLLVSYDAILQYNDASVQQLLTNAKLTQGLKEPNRVGKCSEANEQYHDDTKRLLLSSPSLFDRDDIFEFLVFSYFDLLGGRGVAQKHGSGRSSKLVGPYY